MSRLSDSLRTLVKPLPPDVRHGLWLTQRAAGAAVYLRKVPARPLNDLLHGIDELAITIRHRFKPRALPYGEAYVLSLITAWARPERIFEIGTAGGEGTVLLHSQAPGARVDTLDLGEKESVLGVQEGDAPLESSSVGHAFHGTEHAPFVTQHLGDSARFDYTPFRNQIDLTFVDGAHTYEYALSDSRAALDMARPGGVIVWDDCHLHHAGVPKALAELREEGHDVARVASSRLALMRVPTAV